MTSLPTIRLGCWVSRYVCILDSSLVVTFSLMIILKLMFYALAMLIYQYLILVCGMFISRFNIILHYPWITQLVLHVNSACCSCHCSLQLVVLQHPPYTLDGQAVDGDLISCWTLLLNTTSADGRRMWIDSTAQHSYWTSHLFYTRYIGYHINNGRGATSTVTDVVLLIQPLALICSNSLL